MENAAVFESGAELLDALKSGSSIGHARSYVGMIKASEKQSHIAFAPASCEQWFDLPANLIGKVQVLRDVPCKGHTHQLVRLNLRGDDTNPLMVMTHQMLSTASHAGMQPQPEANPVNGATQFPFVGVALPTQNESALSPMQMGGQHLDLAAYSPVSSDRPFNPNQRFSTLPNKVTFMAAGRGVGGLGFTIECDLDCCVACCRDCFPWIGCVDYPCCKLTNCKIKF